MSFDNISDDALIQKSVGLKVAIRAIQAQRKEMAEELSHRDLTPHAANVLNSLSDKEKDVMRTMLADGRNVTVTPEPAVLHVDGKQPESASKNLIGRIFGR